MDPDDGHPAIEVAGARRPLPGQSSCGDAWAQLTSRDGRTLIALFDGLGHGEEAAAAADVATEFLHAQAPRDGGKFDLPRLMSGLDHALRKTRGVVASMAVIDPSRRLLLFAGVGNIEGYVLGASPVRLVASFGMLGRGNRRPIRSQVVEFPPGTTMVLHTDGVAGVALPQIPRLRPCAVVAQFMIAQWARPDDDAAVLVARYAEDHRGA